MSLFHEVTKDGAEVLIEEGTDTPPTPSGCPVAH